MTRSRTASSATKLVSACFAALVAFSLFPSQAAADLEPSEQSSERSSASWTFGSDGFRFKSDDEDIELRLRARLEGEAAVFSSNDILESQTGELDNDFQVRRARIALQGSRGRMFQFKMEADYSDSDLSIETVYAGLRRLPHNLRVRVGHIKEPFALEWAMSSRDAMFMERSVISALRPSRNTGVLVNHGSKTGRVAFAAGLYRSIRGLEDYDVGKKPTGALTVRATGLPWVDTNREGHAIHVGMSYSQRNYLDDQIRFRAEPELDLAPNFANTGTLVADGSALLGLEFALLAGPWILQAETVRADVDSAENDDPVFDASYLALSWFPTGESQPYDRRTGRFRRVHPNRSLLTSKAEKGPGAWQIVLRYSHLDLDDGLVEGGTLRDMTLGVNWYLNPRVRILTNVVHSKLRGSGSVRMAGMRVQMDF